MKVTSAMLLEISAMPEQAMAFALRVLAEQLGEAEVSEARLAEIRRKDADRKRKKRGSPLEIQRKSGGSPLARVEDKPLPFSKTDISQIDTPFNSPTEPLEASRETFNALTDGWAKFWAAYPKRAGGRDKQNAFKAFKAASKRAEISTIIEGARAYADYCHSTGKSGTEFIRQARTWLNANGWTEDYSDAGQPPKHPANAIIEKFLNG